MEPTPGAGPRYDRGVIWEPFVLALFLGLIVSAGLYFAYLWPSVEPSDEEPVLAAADSRAPETTASAPTTTATAPAATSTPVAAANRSAALAAKDDETPLPPAAPEPDDDDDDAPKSAAASPAS